MPLSKLIFKLYCWIGIFSAGIFIASCGSDHSNSTSAYRLSSSSFIFGVADYTANTYFYDLNLVDLSYQMLPYTTLSSDTVVYQKNKSQGVLETVYLADRMYQGTLSSPTYMLGLTPEGATFENFYNLPVNLYDILPYNDGSLAFVGLQEKQTSQLSADLQTVYRSADVVNPFNPEVYADSFIAILGDQTKNYIVTLGFIDYNKPSNPKTAASLVPLADLSQAELDNENIVRTLLEDPDSSLNSCYNVSSTQKISQKVLLVTCNPDYYRAEGNSHGQNLSMYLVDVTNPQTVRVSYIYSIPISEKAEVLSLGGLSKDGSQVLVSQETFDWSAGNVVQAVYWLDVAKIQAEIAFNEYTPNSGAWKEGYTTPTLGSDAGFRVAGNVLYDAPTDQYIFSCVLNDQDRCQKNTFGIVHVDLGTHQVLPLNVAAGDGLVFPQVVLNP